MTGKKNKLPPFGRALRVRQQSYNPPFLAVVCIGTDAWAHAEQWSQHSDFMAIVLPHGQRPDSFRWPVEGLDCLVERGIGPSDELVVDLIKALFQSDAHTVIVRPNGVDYPKCLDEYDKSTGKWIKTQDRLMVYQNPLFREMPCAS